MKLVEVAPVGELFLGPNSFQALDELAATSLEGSAVPAKLSTEVRTHLYLSACSSHHCPILVNSALNHPETTLTEIRPLV